MQTHTHLNDLCFSFGLIWEPHNNLKHLTDGLLRRESQKVSACVCCSIKSINIYKINTGALATAALREITQKWFGIRPNQYIL